MNSIEKKDNKKLRDKKMIDPFIELLRIIGCISVIGTHIKLDLKKKISLLISPELLLDVSVLMEWLYFGI